MSTFSLRRRVLWGLGHEQVPPLPIRSTICLGHRLLRYQVHSIIRWCKPCHSPLANAFDVMWCQHRPPEWSLHHQCGLLVLPWHWFMFRPPIQTLPWPHAYTSYWKSSPNLVPNETWEHALVLPWATSYHTQQHWQLPQCQPLSSNPFNCHGRHLPRPSPPL